MRIHDSGYLRTTEYGMGTWVKSSHLWGTYLSAVVLCSDGKTRKTQYMAQTADTFFSVRCSVVVKSKTVSGYMTIETAAGMTTETEGDLSVAKFVAVLYGKNHALLPRGAWRTEGAVPTAITPYETER